MNEELSRKYFEASAPYRQEGGPIPDFAIALRSWRYFLEINTACNLRCVLCACACRQGYDHVIGVMDYGLMERILDKIKSENPEAIILPYGNSEPFLHPDLPRCIAQIKARGLRCEIASNLNHVSRLEDLLKTQPDLVIVSVSGFTQKTYGHYHNGGDIEAVKQNMRLLSEAAKGVGFAGELRLNYHLYRDNGGEERDRMLEYGTSLGFKPMTTVARSICMENTIQYLRKLHHEMLGSVPPMGSGGVDWSSELPSHNRQIEENASRLLVSPLDAQEMYKRFPVPEVCPVGDAFTFIRHDGLVSLCACVSDRRLVLGKYLEMTQEQMSEARRGHPVCGECLRLRLNLYFHVVDYQSWQGYTP